MDMDRFCSTDGEHGHDLDDESSSSFDSMCSTSDEEVQEGRRRRNMTSTHVSIDPPSATSILIFYDDSNSDEDYPDTPEHFEDEFEPVPRPKFPKYTPDCEPKDVSFSFSQTFKDAKEFRDAITKYSVASHRDIRFERSNTIRVCARCGDQTCPWRIWCSYEKTVKMFQVKSFVIEHTCEVGEKVRLCNTVWLTKMFMEKFRANPSYKAKHLRADCLNSFGIQVLANKCWQARYACLRQIQGNQQEHFAKIMNYKLELERSNPGSRIAIELDKSKPEKPVFMRMYICFAALKKAWIEGCRPIIGVDGCFLKWFVKGELLCAIGREANNQMFHIAWAVVEVENSQSWEWFLQLLLRDIDFPRGAGLTIISDAQKGLEVAMQKLMPYAKHRLCARHIYANWRKTHKQPELKPLFWAVAKAYTENEVNDNLQEILKVSKDAFADLKKSNMSSWCRAYFNDESLSDVVQNNLSEAFNSSVQDARTKPIIDMFEDIRKGVMYRMAEKRTTIDSWPGNITPRIQKQIDRSLKKSFMCNVMTNGNKKYEVTFIDDTRSVDMNKKICSCRSWKLIGILCFHAPAIIMHRKEKITDHVSSYYKKEAWAKCYATVLDPINGEKEWPRSLEPAVLPPTERVMPGRPKRNRIKDPHESPKKKGKVTRQGRVMTCQHCLQTGHNSAGCLKKSNGEPRAPRPQPTPKPRGRPRSAQPRSSARIRHRERGGRTKASNWNRSENNRTDEWMFREGYGVYYDQRSGELMLQSGRNRYGADGSMPHTIPPNLRPQPSSNPGHVSQPSIASQPSSSSQQMA